jgi:RNA polymerase sigma-70 factor (ECF subfamily)
MEQAFEIHLVREAEEPRTLAACYRAHRDGVYRTCLLFGGGRTAWAEDATHDVFVKLIEALPRLHDHHDLGGWLYRVSVNLCISRLKRERRLLYRVFPWLESSARADVDLFAGLEAQERARAALATLDGLPARERAVFVMKVLESKPQHEIADVLGISEGYVSKLLARAWARVVDAGWAGTHD